MKLLRLSALFIDLSIVNIILSNTIFKLFSIPTASKFNVPELQLLILLIVIFLYSFYFEKHFKATLGMMLFDLEFKFPNKSSQKLFFIQRGFYQLLSSIPLFLGYASLLWDNKARTWVDKFSNDEVILNKKSEIFIDYPIKSRLYAYLIDSVFAFTLVLMIIGSANFSSDFQGLFLSNEETKVSIYIILNFLVAGFYNVIAPILFSGRTLGLHLNKLSIKSKTGKKLSLPIMLNRYFMSLFSSFFFHIGNLWVFQNPRKQTFQDISSQTFISSTKL